MIKAGDEKAIEQARKWFACDIWQLGYALMAIIPDEMLEAIEKLDK